MEKKRILIADDVRAIRILLAAALRSCGYEIDIAENGIEALSLIENKQYDLIITDYIMPEMDGLELTRRVKEKYPSIPILILTAEGFKDDFLRSGATACVVKPFDINELKKIIQDLLDKKVKPAEEGK
ncbi:MAG TPA: response regulator [Desulfatiglandales bacterium]|nr:response regulator [Desulfatiglandales bacterium]